ncbi:unnamed protein product [Strongylus vulgaris]|uniref:Reverse transcriptase domain-containing protein n=1 Tax=Strongylus vulgaris TaxID=40348 RepID=A0A3P7LA79_STRVU|nr:unnamed protein product [Strongylus vulgaris]
MPEGEHTIGRFGSGLPNENDNRLIGLLSGNFFTHHLDEEATPAVKMGAAQRAIHAEIDHILNKGGPTRPDDRVAKAVYRRLTLGDEINGNEKGIRVDGSLSNLRFADDIVLFSRNITEAKTMLKEINEVGKQIGLRINRKKTQFMKNALGSG